MDEVRAAHDQARSLKIDENALHTLRRNERRTRQRRVRNARVVSDGQQHRVLGGSNAKPRELRIEPLPQQMLGDFQFVADPASLIL